MKNLAEVKSLQYGDEIDGENGAFGRKRVVEGWEAKALNDYNIRSDVDSMCSAVTLLLVLFSWKNSWDLPDGGAWSRDSESEYETRPRVGVDQCRAQGTRGPEGWLDDRTPRFWMAALCCYLRRVRKLIRIRKLRYVQIVEYPFMPVRRVLIELILTRFSILPHSFL